MSFLQFLTYFIIASFIWQFVLIFLDLAFKKYAERKLKKSIESGKIRMITLDELYEMQENKDDKKWN